MEPILAGRAKDYLPRNVDQRRLLPVDRREWLPEGHLALFVLDVVAELDLSEVTRTHEAKDPRGRAGFHPVRMVAMLVYGYCTGKRSSRKLEKATYDEVPFCVITGDQHPDHDSIADFRKRPLKALAGLFVQVLLLCQKAGRVKLGHVSLDGTKIRANASKHKAMSYERRSETEQRLQREVEALLEEAERVEQQEDAKFGKGNRTTRQSAGEDPSGEGCIASRSARQGRGRSRTSEGEAAGARAEAAADWQEDGRQPP